jgi:hypothetical protein
MPRSKKEKTVISQFSVVKTFRMFVIACSIAAFGVVALGQTGQIAAPVSRPLPIVERNNLYCAGFVQTAPINTANRIVGAEEEADQFMYSENNVVYLNAGSNRGMAVGAKLAVVRPRGQVRSPWSRKGNLGFLVQEVGAVEIIAVRREVSIAKIINSCDNFLLGDLVQPWQDRTSPMFAERPALDRFAPPSGKAVGRIFLARDNQEMITREQIVYVDLGREDNVQQGDFLTFFRPLGKGNILSGPPESVSARDYGYESLTYKGGRFSNQAQRKKGDRARGAVQTTPDAKRGRPSDLRKIVGEGVVINVKERTATVVITRTTQEIHTGDFAEIQ